MKVSEMIEKLNELKEIHGDVDVKIFNDEWCEFWGVGIHGFSREDNCIVLDLD